MSETNTTLYCHIHPKRETSRCCTRCERPACPSCLHDAPVGQHCTSCIRDNAPSTRTQAQRNLRTTKARFMSGGVVVTKVLIAINALIFVTQYVQTQSSAFSYGQNASRGGLVEKWILFAPLVAKGEWWRLLTAGFLHQALIHIGMNMLSLWRIGHVWEQRLGPARFLGVYMASLLGGSLAIMMFTPQVSVLGASGALFGFLGIEFAAYRQRKIPITKSPLAQVLLLNLIISVVFPVSITGHGGGLIVGALIGGVFTNPKRRQENRKGDLVLCLITCLALFGAAVLFAKSPIKAEGIFPR